MRKVQVILGRASLDGVRELLRKVGVDGMTLSQVSELAPGLGHVESYRGSEVVIHGEPRIRIEIVVEDERTPALVDELRRATRTGRKSDGVIFVLPVDDGVRIRTGERGWDAL